MRLSELVMFLTVSKLHLLKKTTLDANILKNYRPVLNLPFTSKVLEKALCKQIDNIPD